MGLEVYKEKYREEIREVWAKRGWLGFAGLMEKKPIEAKRHLEAFMENIFWRYYESYFEDEMAKVYDKLLTCEPEELDRIRLKIAVYGDVIAFPQNTLNKIKDEILLTEEAAKGPNTPAKRK